MCLALFAWLAWTSAAACGGERADEDRPLVVVSVLPLAWFVEQLAGDRVRVEVVIPPGASPATFEPSMRQLRAVTQAALYVKVGHPRFPFERAWLDPLLAESEDLPIVDASAGLEEPGEDPHVWVSPRHARAIARSLHEGLTALSPDSASELDASLDRVLREIEALDGEIRGRLAGYAGQRFLVYHSAWGHFAEEYGLVQVAIERGHQEPDAAAIRALIEMARSRRLRVVFVQPQFSRASAQVVAEAIGARIEVLDPLARDWADNLRRVSRALVESFAS